MEQKKKRVRPSLTQMRALQAELAEVKENYRLQMIESNHLSEEVKELKTKLLEKGKSCESQIDGTSVIVQESDAWREKYRDLQGKYDDQLEGTSMLVADCDAWRKKYHDLLKKTDVNRLYELMSKLESKEKDCEVLEKELERIRIQSDKLDQRCTEYREKNFMLKSRGFWARVFNIGNGNG